MHRFIISKFLKRLCLSQKKSQKVGYRQNEKLRLIWIIELFYIITKQLIFIDEILFNEFTSWRHRVYVFVD